MSGKRAVRIPYLKIAIAFVSVIIIGAGNIGGYARDLQQQDELRPKSTSPYEIAKAVNESQRIWNKDHIQVHVDLSVAWRRFGIQSEYFPECAGDCEAEIYRHELDSRPGQEIILKLTHSFNSCRYLIFTSVQRNPARRFRWKFVGHIDHEFNRYQMSSHRVVQALGKNWLVVRGQEGSGSGYRLYGETWYEVRVREVSPVLHYWSEGGTNPVISGLSWQFENRPIALRKFRSGHSRIALRFVVKYTANDFDKDKFTDTYVTQRRAVYLWKKGLRTFVFDSRNSTITEAEMAGIANVETEPDEADSGVKIGGSVFFSQLKGFVGNGFEIFLKLNFNRLMKIARGSDVDRREWLSQFLKDCNETPEKIALSKALQTRLPVFRKQM